MEKKFDTVESIFQIFKSSDEIATQRISYGGRHGYLVSKVRSLIGDSENGATPAVDFVKELSSLYAAESSNNPNKQFLNHMINFYSTAFDSPEGKFGELTSPYTCETTDGKEKSYDKTATMFDIIQMSKSNSSDDASKTFPQDKQFSVAVVRNPLTSPAMQNVGKVESFLNFLPSIVLSRCVPYVHVEFVFDRPQSSYGRLAPASTLKFLLGGENIDTKQYTADAAIYKVNNLQAKVEDKGRVFSRAGMDLFTSPQTMVNMNPVGDRARYVDVLDPTRPFATLESLSINITGTTETINFKTGQLVIKLHDRSRLAELSDLFQPGTSGGPGIAKCTVWLTYGMRHPKDSSAGTAGAKTYEQFINDNMMVKEAYGVRNASFSFEGSGQVSITLQLDAKGGTDVLLATLEDSDSNTFKQMIADKKAIVDQIAKDRKDLNLSKQPKGSDNSADANGGESVEIRGYAIIEAAANNVYPEYKKDDINRTIAGLEKVRGSFGPALQIKVDRLIENLKKYYDEKNKSFGKEAKEKLIEKIVQDKFKSLASGLDPFLPNAEKHKAMMKDFFDNDSYPHPYISEIEKYKNDEVLAPGMSPEGVSKKVVSFGKLFSVFMAMALKKLDGIDEFQVFFYNINDLAGKASGTNLAEFPIDLPRFLRRYQEHLDSREAALITVQEFVQLVIESQLESLHAIPYGFRSYPKFFQPWKKGASGDEMTKEGSAQYPAYAVEVNAGRGTFQMPNIEILLETQHFKRKIEDGSRQDLLSYFEEEQSNLTKTSLTGYGKALKIHIFDAAQNPHRGTETIYRGNQGSEYAWEFPQPFNPYAQKTTVDAAAMMGISDSSTQKSELTSAQINERVRNKSFDRETFTGDRTDRQKMMKLIARGIPMLIPGMEASAIKEASFASQADAAMQAAQMTGISPSEDIQGTPRGDGIGNLPMRVIPSTMSMRTIGCPLLRFGQMYFIDMNTGTTIDNVYGLNSITHEFAPGKYESALEFVPYDAYGRYESAREYNIETLINVLEQRAEQTSNANA